MTGQRPQRCSPTCGHRIGAVFRRPSGIPPDATIAWSMSGQVTEGSETSIGWKPPAALPRFFIEFLTEPEEVRSDIFSGSNTTD